MGQGNTVVHKLMFKAVCCSAKIGSSSDIMKEVNVARLFPSSPTLMKVLDVLTISEDRLAMVTAMAIIMLGASMCNRNKGKLCRDIRQKSRHHLHKACRILGNLRQLNLHKPRALVHPLINIVVGEDRPSAKSKIAFGNGFFTN